MKQQYVYVIAKDGTVLMPTQKFGMVRHFLDDGKAIPVKTKPFTIRLTYETEHHTQNVVVGIDTGYENVGVSAVTTKAEIYSAEIELLKGMKQRLEKRRKYRSQRRNRLRYRKPRFDNRKASKPKGWLAPSIKHKLDSHIRFIESLAKLLPISEINVEVANFDIQKIKDSEIEGEKYQQGEQLGFWNLRDYILHRDHHICQNPNCNNRGYDHRVNGKLVKAVPLEVHHLGFLRNDRSDRPVNLITLCSKCHTPANHKQGKLLYGWKPELNSFRPETFMSTVRWRMIELFKEKFPDVEVNHTYGYLTKNTRIEFGIEKSHSNDAFVIAGGTSESQSEAFEIIQVKRNNRSLEKFYDAQYSDVRTGKKASGQDLSLQRRGKPLDEKTENLRVYRGHKVKKGRRSVRKKRYLFQPEDTVVYRGKKVDEPVKCQVKGAFNKGTWVRLKHDGKTINSSVKDVAPYCYGKGYSFLSDS